MATEFDDSQHFATFKEPGAIRTGNAFDVRWSEITLASLRAAGFLDNMVDGLVPPSIDMLWLDKNLDPAVLKEWNPAGFNWEPVTSQTLFGRVPWRGPWNSMFIYRRGDLVSFQGSIWIAAQPSQNRAPAEDAYWDLFMTSLADDSVTPEKVADGVIPFATKAAAVSAVISPSIHAIELFGSASSGDGLGGLYIDTNNGSADTFTSNGGTRTWYLAADVSEKRLKSTVIDLINGLAATAAANAISKKTAASIKHVRDGTYIYDVITVKNPSPKLVRQEFAPGVAADGVVTRISCQQYAKATGAQIVVNASGFRAPDGGSYETSPQARPMGLSIANNILYQDWLPAETRTQAIVMGKDGKLVEANKGDGISGAQWVAAGAEWAVCFGVICVRNGAAVNVDASYIGTAISARTIIGQKANGDILIITVEGSTGVYGASGTQCGVIAQSLGCTIAYVCDGGGSTQAWWKDCYSIPTSDATERALPNFFVIDADIIGDYDTGWVSLPLEAGLSAQVGSLPGLAFRQVNETIHLQVNVAAAATFTTTATVLHTNDFPVRFQPFIVGLGRGFVSGPSGNAGSVFMGAKISGKAQTGTLTYISGVISWPAKYAGLPAQAS